MRAGVSSDLWKSGLGFRIRFEPGLRLAFARIRRRDDSSCQKNIGTLAGLNALITQSDTHKQKWN